MQLVGKLHQAGKIHHLHQVYGVFGCVYMELIGPWHVLRDAALCTCMVKWKGVISSSLLDITFNL